MEHPALLPIKFIILIFFCSCNAAVKETSALPMANSVHAQITNSNGIILSKGKPFTGVLFTLYPETSDTAAIQQFENGKEDGEWRKYYPDRSIKEIREFLNGYKTGMCRAWWPNGKKMFESRFLNDEYEGAYLEWNMNGLLIKKMNYIAGHEEGNQQWWYDNGKIKANYIIKNGRRFGLLGTKNCVNVSDSIFKN
ncbi:hypothetical protein BH09BAC2_BH09BAC2_07760 [soil metagenome]